MNDYTKTMRLTTKLLEVAQREVDSGRAGAGDAVQAALMTTLSLAKVCARHDPTDDEFDLFVDEVTDALMRHVKSWKGGVQCRD